jgi:cell division protein FtsZ
VNIDLNDARKVLENSGTAVMGQAEATGENRAIEAVNDALDSPLLNDNDITGAEQVLLKIVSGVGDDEIKMSELSKIKNKIQQAAGRDVNIIEGIGFDVDLGSAVSVTVIATGFETKKVNEPITIQLEDNELLEDDIQLDIINHKDDDTTTTQQTLSLEDDAFEFVNTKSDIVNLVEEESVKKVLKLDDDDTVTELEEVGNAINDPINFISDIIEESKEERIDLDNDEMINTEKDLLHTDQSMRIEAREREDRLREISIKLRTPSGLTKLEDEPAFKRNNINLEENTHSSEDDVSHYTLTDSEDDKIILKDDNPYLHDNVD